MVATSLDAAANETQEDIFSQMETSEREAKRLEAEYEAENRPRKATRQAVKQPQPKTALEDAQTRFSRFSISPACDLSHTHFKNIIQLYNQ